MVDGFLLFTIVDVWRMIVPLGLTCIVFMTEIFGRMWHRDAHFKSLGDVLGPLGFRLTFSFLIISGIIGFLVPSMLGYSLPESHIAEGPWGYEEILGYILGGLCLWRSLQQDRLTMNLRLLWIGCAAVVFLGIGVLWVARWDAMAHGGQVPGGWFILELSFANWMRVVPKVFHLFFSGLAAGGVLVTLFGLLGRHEAAAGADAGVMSMSSPAIIRYGIGWILAGVVPQMLIGPWLFLVLGEVPRGDLVEGITFSSLLFFVSVTSAFLALVLLNASFMVPHVKGLVWGGLLSVTITLALMGVIRYIVFLATLASQGIPIAIGKVTSFHLLTVMILLGLLGAILVRWCVKPVFPSSHLGQRLDKRFLAN
jgi:hypothetical protein